MRILAIGNSFSQDATRYLHDIARADGIELEVINLYIGGCSLERHYRNMLSGERAYQLQFNGDMTGFLLSLDEALLSRQFDVVTLQQCSPQSFKPETYQPYIEELAEHVRICQPKAKLLIHQTWAYEADSPRLLATGNATPAEMLAGIRKSYAKAALEVKADGMIPSGEMMYQLTQLGVEKVHRDTFHAKLGVGRYALALLWYRMLTGNAVAENTYADFDEPVTEDEIKIVKSCVGSFTPVQ